MSPGNSSTQLVIPSDALLDHWQGHRRLTRRVIDAFADDQLFTYRLEPMRPFGMMALEIISMSAPMVRGIATGETGSARHHDPSWVKSVTNAERPKVEVLRLWDEGTREIDTLWPQIRPGRFQETMTAFGQYTGAAYGLLLYVIDNEIHHRGQGWVYLRHLGIETPKFWERQ